MIEADFLQVFICKDFRMTVTPTYEYKALDLSTVTPSTIFIPVAKLQLFYL